MYPNPKLPKGVVVEYENTTSTRKGDLGKGTRATSYQEITWSWMLKTFPSDALSIEVRVADQDGQWLRDLERTFPGDASKEATQYALDLIQQEGIGAAWVEGQYTGYITVAGRHDYRTARVWVFGRYERQATPNSGSGDHYVWVLAHGKDEPLSGEGPYGPFSLMRAEQMARIGAQKGAHDRVVSRGVNPSAKGFRVLRRYSARTGTRLV